VRQIPHGRLLVSTRFWDVVASLHSNVTNTFLQSARTLIPVGNLHNEQKSGLATLHRGIKRNIEGTSLRLPFIALAKR
jgi:hypothetical protein